VPLHGPQFLPPTAHPKRGIAWRKPRPASTPQTPSVYIVDKTQTSAAHRVTADKMSDSLWNHAKGSIANFLPAAWSKTSWPFWCLVEGNAFDLDDLANLMWPNRIACTSRRLYFTTSVQLVKNTRSSCGRELRSLWRRQRCPLQGALRRAHRTHVIAKDIFEATGLFTIPRAVGSTRVRLRSKAGKRLCAEGQIPASVTSQDCSHIRLGYAQNSFSHREIDLTL